MSKKVNPNRIPCTQADVDRAKRVAVKEATTYAMAIMLTVLVDKFNGADYLPDIWREVNKLSEEITEKRVSVPDLVRVLREEYNISI